MFELYYAKIRFKLACSGEKIWIAKVSQKNPWTPLRDFLKIFEPKNYIYMVKAVLFKGLFLKNPAQTSPLK